MLYWIEKGLDNLSRPHFKTTSWHFPNHVNDWPSIDSIDTPLSRGSRFFANGISHAERAFSLLLAGGALANHMKLTTGGRSAFSAGSPQQDRVPDSS